jgi:hypothetical protein
MRAARKILDDTPCGSASYRRWLIVLTMFRKRLFAYSDGKLSLYADLSDIATGTIDDMIVDGLAALSRSRLQPAAARGSRHGRPPHPGDARWRGPRDGRRIAVSQRDRGLGR